MVLSLKYARLRTDQDTGYWDVRRIKKMFFLRGSFYSNMPDLLPFVLSDRSFAKSFRWTRSSNMHLVHTLGLLSHTTSFLGFSPTGF